MSGDLVGVPAKEPVTRLAGIVGFIFVLLTPGCAGLGTPPSDAPSQNSASRAGADAVAPASPRAPLPSALPPPVATQAGIPAIPPASDPSTPSAPAVKGQTAGETVPPAAKIPAKPPASPAPAAQPSRQETTRPGVASPKAPPLNLASLEQRLRETQAIGVLTKIALKNQIDDLLGQFRAFYQGKLKSNLADLRRSYDLLVLKVLSLLQDSDQALATAIAASREAIWGILSDPAKFATI